MEEKTVQLDIVATQESIRKMQDKAEELAQTLQKANSLLSELASFELVFYVKA